MVFEAARCYDAGEPCGVEANAAKLPGGRSGYRASERAVFAHGDFGYATEFDVERFMREIWIARLAPVSEQLNPELHRRTCSGPPEVLLTARFFSPPGGESPMHRANPNSVLFLTVCSLTGASGHIPPLRRTSGRQTRKAGLLPFNFGRANVDVGAIRGSTRISGARVRRFPGSTDRLSGFRASPSGSRY